MIKQVNEYEDLVMRYISFKRAQGLKESTLGDLAGRLKMIGRECGIQCVEDINANTIQAWFSDIGEVGIDGRRPDRAAATRLLLWKYGHGFFAWLVMRGDIEDNPIDNAPRPKHLKRDIRRKRRAYGESELRNLFRVARLRTLAEYGKRRLIGCKDKDAWHANPITLDNIDEFADHCRECLARNPKELRRKEIDGRKWELIYKCLLYTGLKWSELRTLEVRWVTFGENPTIDLDPFHEKNGQGNVVPIKVELAAELAHWVKERGLKGTDRLLDMPHKCNKRLGYDLAAAGITKLDSRGRSVDAHALRHTMASFMVRAGVNPKVLQASLRHADCRMSLNLYSHCEEAEVAIAVGKLPLIDSKPAVSSDEVAPVASSKQLNRRRAVASLAIPRSQAIVVLYLFLFPNVLKGN